MNKYWCSWFGV